MRRFVTITGEPAVFELEFNDLNGTAALFCAVFPDVFTATTGVGEVKQKRAVAADNQVGGAIVNGIAEERLGRDFSAARKGVVNTRTSCPD